MENGWGTLKNPTEQQVSQFWGFARDHVGWATLEGIFGQQQASTMKPPWMHLAGEEDEADALLNQFVKEGTLELATEFPADVFEAGDTPKRGDLAILCDSEGRPTALAATLKVVDGPEDTGGQAPVRIVKETLRCLYPKQD